MGNGSLKQLDCIDGIAVEVNDALTQIEAMARDAEAADPFGFLLDFKSAPIIVH